MSTPQPGVFAASGPLHLALEYDAPALDAATLGAARRALADGAEGADDAVIALGARAYRRLGGAAEARPLAAIEGVANTPRDIFIWLRSATRDRLFDSARAADAALGGGLALETAGFDYRDSRDLTGFVDGTANPKGAAAREAALVPAGAPGAGGTHVLTQRWRHDLAAFHALPVAEQERIIGRTRADSVELSGAAMPDTAHVARVDTVRDGVAQTIFRRSFPWGGVAEHGLYFLAFSRDATRFEYLLRRMFGAAGDGVRDRLTGFSTPVTGALWFAPSLEELDRLAA